MNTISDKLSHLLETKSLIKEAIKTKGVDVPDDATFRQYAELINQIINKVETENTVASCIVGLTYRKEYDGIIIVPSADTIVCPVSVATNSGFVIVPNAEVIIGEYIIEEETTV